MLSNDGPDRKDLILEPAGNRNLVCISKWSHFDEI